MGDFSALGRWAALLIIMLFTIFAFGELRKIERHLSTIAAQIEAHHA